MAVITRAPVAPEAAPAQADAPRAEPRRRRRWPRRLLWAIGVYVVVSGLLLAVSVLLARQGIDELRAFRREAAPGDLLDGTASDRLGRAGSDLDRAALLVGGPWMTPLRLVPGLGRQVDAVQSMIVGSADITALAAEGVEDAEATVGAGIPTGPGRVDALRTLAEVAESTAASLNAVDAGPQTWLLPGLGAAAVDFADQKADIEESLLRTRDASAALATVLEGPSTYLLLAANNGEMRSGSGMLLSAGLLTAADGELDVTDLEPTAEMVLPEPVGITDPDIEQQWGFSGPDQDFRNLLLSPRFGPNAEMATRMWTELGRPEVDGVITIDVLALEGLLEAVGPVTVGTEVIDHTNVRRLLLHDQYTRVSDDAQGQADRRDVLGTVARAVLERFDTTAADPGPLARALRDATAGRHLMIWSRDEGLEQAWRGVSVAGDVAADGVLVSVLNDGNNKLDQYLEIDAELDPVDATSGTLRLELTNTVPAGEPNYIAGAFPDQVGGYGVYPGRLAVHFPAGTQLEVVEGPEATLAGPDGGSTLLATEIRVPPGETLVWELHYELGQALEGLRVLPSARSPGIEWTVGDQTWSDRRVPSRTVDLD